MFRLVSLWAHFCRVSDSPALLGASVTLLLFTWVSFSCSSPKRKSVCLVCHFIYLSVSCACACTRVGDGSGRDGFSASLGFDHDLLLKPCGRSSRSQTSPTTDDLTLLLSVCGSASSGLQNTCMFTVKRDRKQTVCRSHACTQKCTPPSLKTV